MSWNSIHPCGTNHAATRSAASRRCCCQVSSDQTIRGCLVPALNLLLYTCHRHRSCCPFLLLLYSESVLFLGACRCLLVCMLLLLDFCFFGKPNLLFSDCGDDWNGSNDELGTCCFPSCLVMQVGVVWKKRKSLWLV